jgi:hypothetical protein
MPKLTTSSPFAFLSAIFLLISTNKYGGKLSALCDILNCNFLSPRAP